MKCRHDEVMVPHKNTIRVRLLTEVGAALLPIVTWIACFILKEHISEQNDQKGQQQKNTQNLTKCFSGRFGQNFRRLKVTSEFEQPKHLQILVCIINHIKLVEAGIRILMSTKALSPPNSVQQ